MREFSLRRISAPAVEPVTLAEVKEMAGIYTSAYDLTIERWIKAGREMAEEYQGRAYYTQTWEMSFNNFPGLPVKIPRAPLISISSISYIDTNNVETAMSLSDFIIDANNEPGRVDLNFGVYWPSVVLRTVDSFRIRYLAGYGDAGTTTSSPDYIIESIPPEVKEAIILYCSWKFENKAADGEYAIINPLQSAAPIQFYRLLDGKRLFYDG